MQALQKVQGLAFAEKQQRVGPYFIF
jgi:hypothetical protein